MTLFKKAKDTRDHFKVLLRNTKIKREQLKQWLIVVEKEENRPRMVMYGVLVVFTL